ncbi:hypothetical protein M0R45_016841 [Rubus argutus]|uniref:Uncharacterized protein n=1 Tax=Rubus argutus TaxID=59490 RepID=A0AAW1XWI1_RUBAR
MLLHSHKLCAASGEPGDRVQFTEYIQKNRSLISPAMNWPPPCGRTHTMHVNILMAGFDKDNGAEVYYIDTLLPFTRLRREPLVTYGSYFALYLISMDQLYHKVDKDGAREYARGESIKDAGVAAA